MGISNNMIKNKWKLIHKKTNLSLNQLLKEKEEYSVSYYDGEVYGKISLDLYEKYIPLMTESGSPAIYVDIDYYPYLIILDPNEWIIEQKQ